MRIKMVISRKNDVFSGREEHASDQRGEENSQLERDFAAAQSPHLDEVLQIRIQIKIQIQIQIQIRIRIQIQIGIVCSCAWNKNLNTNTNANTNTNTNTPTLKRVKLKIHCSTSGQSPNILKLQNS